MRATWTAPGIAILFLAAGCGGGGSETFGDDNDDVDGDGWTAEDGDCDDRNASIYPGAEEICDGADSDCDGTIPDDELTDQDGDGWILCMDCDDTAKEIHPGAEEVCDGVDNDCNPDTNENMDVDGDGFSVCDEDCDDGDAALTPEDHDGDGSSS